MTKLEQAKQITALLRLTGQLEVKAADVLRAALHADEEDLDIDGAIKEASRLLLEAQLSRKELMDKLDNWNFGRAV